MDILADPTFENEVDRSGQISYPFDGKKTEYCRIVCRKTSAMEKTLMKITSVHIWTVVVPTIPGRVHSPEWVPETGWDQVPKHIVRLNTDSELSGIGETLAGQLLVANTRDMVFRKLKTRRDPGCPVCGTVETSGMRRRPEP